MTDNTAKNTLTMYGIKNCDTIKKARKYLESQGVDYQFHDYRADGLDAALLQRFIDTLGWQALLNTRGTTWRKLEESERNAVDNPATALKLMLAQPAIIKRPLLCAPDGSMLLGFSETTYTPFIQEKS
ncbi:MULTISPECIES: ArsC family reductase [Erwiniaceae]|uniref:ArsC family reductase n=2 Tax=Erwiniaceae TaxID=1903409 RepID=A0ACC5RTA8_ENTAG|nr:MULTISPECIES: ArsC family reductase [Erwiniaceae]MBK4727880.1 ArsC family reductase [Pantoea agglomerans]MBP2157018.1 Spx/MgsR family transcriptional regulator [Erwinia rhapontici]MCS3608920.1 Spx/MgsR family transcriptional regulator [Erwinia rhapontici]NKG32599.1 ArsC family reductase [Erwinia rhapontici]NNS07195.1 ArsC family reductase [Erwinia sp. JH02]